MPITLRLCEDSRILVYTIVGRWEIPDIVGKFEEERTIRDRVQHRIHMFVDLRAMQNVPAKLIAIRGAPGMTHPTSGHVAIVGASAIARTLGQSLFRVLGFDRAHFFDSEDDAWIFLRSVLAAEAHTSRPTTDASHA